MNTVDSLKKLYKTMAGKDWPYDPNPTDAEVIDKITADGNAGGGSGSGDKSRIEMHVSMDDGNVDPLPAGLEVSDFIDSIMVVHYGETVLACVPTMGIINDAAQGRINILAPNILSSLEQYIPPILLRYYPATGEVITGQNNYGGNS